MSALTNPLLIILAAILAAVIINLVLVAVVKNNSKRVEGSVLNRMLKSAQSPFRETDRSLAELDELIQKSKVKSNNSDKPIVEETTD